MIRNSLARRNLLRGRGILIASLLAAAALLSACDGDRDPAVVTVTETVTHPATPARPAAPAPADPELCKQIEAQRDVNARLHSDGYADDYTAEYDKLLDANNCP